jgi:autophagy-related protein 18
MRVIGAYEKEKETWLCVMMQSVPLLNNVFSISHHQGTVIRVFYIPSADKVYQFRRGSYPAKIYSMSFNLVSTLLCVSSDTETVHIFKLSQDSSASDDMLKDQQQVQQQRKSTFGKSFLPDRLTDMWESSRHFASLKLPNAGVRNLVALSSTTPQVLVITSEGYFYQYNIDLENGGECVLLKQNR